MNITVKMDQRLSKRFIDKSRSRRGHVNEVGRVLTSQVAHFGIRRFRDLTASAIKQHGEDFAEQDARWSDVGTNALPTGYRWAAKKAVTKFRTWRRRRKLKIKVYAEKTTKTGHGWTSAVVNRTTGILRLNEAAGILRQLIDDMGQFTRKELRRLVRKIK